MTLKSDNHAINALAEEVYGEVVTPLHMYGYITPDELAKACGPRLQDGTSYFHGIYNEGLGG